MDWKSSFHQKINWLFDRAKDNDYRLTQEQYAEKIGTSKNALRGWLKGAGEPNSNGLCKIAEAENVSVDWLVGYSDDQQKDKPHTFSEELISCFGNTTVEIIETINNFSEIEKAQILGFAKSFRNKSSKNAETG